MILFQGSVLLLGIRGQVDIHLIHLLEYKWYLKSLITPPSRTDEDQRQNLGMLQGTTIIPRVEKSVASRGTVPFCEETFSWIRGTSWQPSGVTERPQDAPSIVPATRHHSPVRKSIFSPRADSTPALGAPGAIGGNKYIRVAERLNTRHYVRRWQTLLPQSEITSRADRACRKGTTSRSVPHSRSSSILVP